MQFLLHSTSQKTHYFFITKIKQVVVFNELIAVHSAIDTKYINTLCEYMQRPDC
jgi:hypothetical protein